LGLLLLGWFTQLVLWVSGNADVARKIANAHMLFNTLGVIAMIPFVGLLEKLLNKIVPVKFSAEMPELEEMKVA
ncbi:MAG: hypothetical protein SFU87_12115, partial [Chitinophagaceae bacterium]|nr:hypothetical protein [Chitinophagaceae bacterium]